MARNAVVVAHPDDEVIFSGALILSRPADDWTVFCLTGASGPRADAFTRSCAALDADSRMWSTPDTGLVWSATEWIDAALQLKDWADLPSFDNVYTHNPRGEYGHPHHIGVHALVRRLRPDAWSFYNPILSGVGYQARGDDQFSVQATSAKRGLFLNAYGHEMYEALKGDHLIMMRHLFHIGEDFTR